MFKRFTIPVCLLAAALALSCHSNNTPKPPAQVSQVLADEAKSDEIKKARIEEEKYQESQKAEHLTHAMYLYGSAAERDELYLVDAVRVMEMIRQHDPKWVYDRQMAETLLGVHEKYPNDQAIAGFLEEMYRPHVEERSGSLDIKPELRYRPADILQREPGMKGWQRIRKFYCEDEEYSLAVYIMESLAEATGRTEEQNLWKRQIGDLLMVRVRCHDSFDNITYISSDDPEQAVEKYEGTTAVTEQKHAAQLAAYRRLQRFFLGTYSYGDNYSRGHRVLFGPDELARAKTLFAIAGWDEARTKRAIAESGKTWAKVARGQTRSAIRKWLNEYRT